MPCLFYIFFVGWGARSRGSVRALQRGPLPLRPKGVRGTSGQALPNVAHGRRRKTAHRRPERCGHRSGRIGSQRRQR